MSPTAINTRHLAASKAEAVIPLIPTIVVASFKGGTWKTSLSVAIAERLAWTGLHVVLLISDRQDDGRRRLGIRARDGATPRVQRGAGAITVVGAAASKAAALLYREGFESMGLPRPDVVVVDTPPFEQGGALPGVFLVATTDGDDASQNLVSMLRRTPATSRVLLVRIHVADPAIWERDAGAIAQAAGLQDLLYLPGPLPPSFAAKEALDKGRSVWGLPRRDATQAFLEGVESVTAAGWSWLKPAHKLPPGPPAPSGGAFISGWDNEDGHAR